MFLLVAGRAQSRSRVDEPIRTQRDYSRSHEPITTSRSTKHRAKESDSSNNVPIIVGPLTTNQDLTATKGERVYNLPLMIQQPFLQEKKEPIKVDISVKLIPKPRKKERKRRESHIEDVTLDKHKGVKNCISMSITDSKVHVLKESQEAFDDETYENTSIQEKVDSRNLDETHDTEMEVLENKCPDNITQNSTENGNIEENINECLKDEQNKSIEPELDTEVKEADTVFIYEKDNNGHA